jgi:hypothetical protein
MSEFGPWQVYPTFPQLGDYIQTEGRLIGSRELTRREGIVTEVRGDRFTLLPAPESLIFVTRWRLRRLPEHEIETTREKELEDA